jgi:hypothetical protein
MPTQTTRTKKCPFCAEVIQWRAVKCRFCGEFLYGDRENSVAKPYADEFAEDGENLAPDEDEVLFWSRPSLWALTGTFAKGAFFFAFAVFLVFYPVAEMLQALGGAGFSEDEMLTIQGYCRMFGVGLAILVVLIVLYKTAALKSVHYEVTADRIEWARGIFSRKIDNLDTFRIVDMKLHRSLFDCLVGIGTVTLITKDKTDPEFEFQKVKQPRALYDVLKKASLEADRKQGVIHIE